MDVTDSEIRETAFKRFEEMRMERYIPIHFLSETVLMFSYSSNPPTQFILSMEETVRNHLNLVQPKVWDLLEPVFENLSKKYFILNTVFFI